MRIRGNDGLLLYYQWATVEHGERRVKIVNHPEIIHDLQIPITSNYHNSFPCIYIRACNCTTVLNNRN